MPKQYFTYSILTLFVILMAIHNIKSNLINFSTSRNQPWEDSTIFEIETPQL